MTTTPNPITPPAELVREWTEDWNCDESIKEPDVVIYVAAQAAQWGADQRLEACCEWLKEQGTHNLAEQLEYARRPKPPTLKQQALEAARIELNPEGRNGRLILQALEALPGD